jgi:glutathionylspermidine synthase
VVAVKARYELSRIDDESFRAIRLRTIFECGKWDPQVGDVASLSPFVLHLEPGAWREISSAAEAMAAELLKAERDLLDRPDLWRRLRLSRGVRKGLDSARAALPMASTVANSVRIVRFDFHWTAEGWRISEANSDVPGGFIESSGFTRLLAEHFGGAATTGDPANELARAFASLLPTGACVALVHATAYTDDRQVMLYLSRALARHGLRSAPIAPDAIEWLKDRPRAWTGTRSESISGIIRFFPGEWLPNLPRRAQWVNLFRGDLVPTSNPATALLTQSKLLPIVQDELATPMTAWTSYLPQTRAASKRLLDDAEWVIKPALGRVGEGVGIAGVTSPVDWKKIRRAVRRRWGGREWIAQRRFAAIPVETEEGPLYPSLGVFVIGKRACGIYGRIARRPLIDQSASDMAVLVGCDEERNHKGTKARSGWKEQIVAAAGTV